MTLGKEERERNNMKVGNWRKTGNTNGKKKYNTKKMEKRKRLRGDKMKNRMYKRERKRWNAKNLSLSKDRKQEKRKR